MHAPQRDEHGKLPTYAWPGGYPIYYLAADGGLLCPDCANCGEALSDYPDDDQWRIVAGGIHWEGGPIVCDNCNVEIESAYENPDGE